MQNGATLRMEPSAPQKIGLALGLSTYQLFHFALFRATSVLTRLLGFSA